MSPEKRPTYLESMFLFSLEIITAIAIYTYLTNPNPTTGAAMLGLSGSTGYYAKHIGVLK